jgi:hypothetical protein
MGHVRLGNLPCTRKWQQVVKLLEEHGSIDAIVAATLSAAKPGLEEAFRDPGVIYSTWLLTQLAGASSARDFVANLNQVGIATSGKPTFHEIVGCFSEAIDKRLRDQGGRTDLGEMAQFSAVESLTSMCASQFTDFFKTKTDDVRTSLRKFSTKKGFAQLSTEYLSRFLHRYLSYYLSRELSNHVGGDRRFFNLHEHSQFLKALEQYSREAASIVQEFAEERYSGATDHGRIDEEKTKAFLDVAFKNITAELTKGV